jgi:hypothetical protein
VSKRVAGGVVTTTPTVSVLNGLVQTGLIQLSPLMSLKARMAFVLPFVSGLSWRRTAAETPDVLAAAAA